MTIYDQIIDNIKADPKAWCQGTYETRTGKDFSTVSACLVGHVDLALRTAYLRGGASAVDEDGDVYGEKLFVSKDEKKWARRHRVVAHLAGLVTPPPVEPVVVEPGEVCTPGTMFRGTSNGEATVTDWNDYRGAWNDAKGKSVGARTRSQVVALLRKASKQYPDD